jgi:plasmid stability protein
MAQVIVRNLDARVVATFKRRARAASRSLEQELRDTLTRAARLTGAEKAALAQDIRAMTPPGAGHVDSAAIIREMREQRWKWLSTPASPPSGSRRNRARGQRPKSSKARSGSSRPT